VDDYLSRGGQGAVFIGEAHGQRAAIKVFSPGADSRRLERELAALQSIDCPSLVKVICHERIEIEGAEYPLVAYEYLSGGDLRGFLEDSAPLAEPQTIVEIGRQIGCAVQALWERRVVHRDIKPANILSAEEGRYVLADVGIARHLDLSDITSPGGAPGTPGYKSPEQARGRRNLTVHSDIFSLGVTLYEVAAKTHPFGRNQNHIGALSPRPLGGARADLPARLVALIHSMIAISPGERPSKIVDRFTQLAEG